MRGIWWQQKSVCVVWVREGFLPIVTRLLSMQMDAITKKAHTMVSSVVVLTYAIQKVKCPDTIVRFKVIDSSSPTIIVVICKSTSTVDHIIIQSKLLLNILASYLPLIVSTLQADLSENYIKFKKENVCLHRDFKLYLERFSRPTGTRTCTCRI